MKFGADGRQICDPELVIRDMSRIVDEVFDLATHRADWGTPFASHSVNVLFESASP